MLKFGLLLVLANLLLKLLLGICMWRMAFEYKSTNDPDVLKESGKYNEEQIEEGDPNILRGQNPKSRINDFENEEQNQSNEN